MDIQELLVPQEELSQKLLEKYNIRGPRYTSYPTAPVWTEDFGPDAYTTAVEQTNRAGQNTSPISLYVHIPFCETQCLYCSCNVVITQKKEQAEKYLTYLFQELEQVASLVASGRQVVQFHWGGGTPTYLSPEQMERLFDFQKKLFPLSDEAEVAIEIDPRVTSSEQLHVLKALGFNRLSLGVQDFEPQVQEAVHRVQPIDMTAAMVQECRNLEFDSINFDLIYGLPYQTVNSFNQTLTEVIRINPDRIALYNYAHVPWISPHQKTIPEETLPGGPVKFHIFRNAMKRLIEAGYVYIGMDHFAKPEDELCRALAEGRLHRNFMGYTVQHGKQTTQYRTDLYGFGSSAISTLDRFYAQNHKKLSTYYDMAERRILPVRRGYALTEEDLLRRRVILSILCQGRLDFKAVAAEFNVEVKTHFQDALSQLDEPTRDGFIHWQDDGFQLTALGRIFSRIIAMPFDAYFQAQAVQGQQQLFSRTL